MINRLAAAAALSTVAAMAVDPSAGVAAAAAFQPITRDGVSIMYQRVTPSGAQQAATQQAANRQAANRQAADGDTRSDYDGDGLDDIAAAARGGVVVRYSSRRWTDYFGTAGGGSALRLGTALASGDFNGDGYDDLAMGDPDETDPLTHAPAGGLWIVPGSAQGLHATATRHLNQSSAGVPNTSAAGDEFAGALAAGDITGDGRADLAVGVPGKDIGAASQAGGLVMLLGAGTGITTTGARWVDQNDPLMPDTAESGDRFGSALAIGRFNEDPNGDLVIGSPGENSHRGDKPGKGLLNLILGTPAGLNVRGVPSIYGDDVEAAAPGVSITRLGAGGLALADADGDGAMDLTAGAPETTVDGHVGAGAVVTIRGSNNGLYDATSVITQNTAGIPGDAEDRDGFGSSVAAGDITGDGYGDLIIGVPYEDVVDAPTAPPGTITNAGVITLLRGSPAGPNGGPAVELSQGYEYTPGTSETNDYFGHDVAVLNLDGRGGLDAAVSAPGERGVDGWGSEPGTPSGDTPGAVTTYSGGDPNFMYGVQRTTGRDVRLPGINTNIYGYVL